MTLSSYNKKVIIIENDLAHAKQLSLNLNERGFETLVCSDTKELYGKLIKDNFGTVLVGMKLKDGNAIDCIHKIIKLSPNSFIVVISGIASIKNAVSAMKSGANDYIEKPVDINVLCRSIENSRTPIKKIIACTKDKINSSNDNFVFRSKSMVDVIEKIKRCASSTASVFLTGESGVGKEVIASLLHNNSNRSSKNMVSVNCAAIPETLVESELFGHAKGSFTGASQDKLGKFECANNGTILLDEVTEMPHTLQAKLLRAIQEKEFSRLGCNKVVPVDVRIIATSNRNLDKAVNEGNLREDLFYRLSVITINIPPLRDRHEDILPLANMFVEKFCKLYGKSKLSISEVSLKKMQEYSWPGNVRELSNAMERSVIMEEKDDLGNLNILI